jgi:hypothetical protein
LHWPLSTPLQSILTFFFSYQISAAKIPLCLKLMIVYSSRSFHSSPFYNFKQTAALHKIHMIPFFTGIAPCNSIICTYFLQHSQNTLSHGNTKYLGHTLRQVKLSDIQGNSQVPPGFRPLRYSSRDGHAEGKHVNRGRDTPSFCPTLQVLGGPRWHSG